MVPERQKDQVERLRKPKAVFVLETLFLFFSSHRRHFVMFIFRLSCFIIIKSARKEKNAGSIKPV